MAMNWNRTVRVMMAALVGLAALAGGCHKKPQADLVLVSPHPKTVQDEFERAFRNWHKAKYGSDVTLEWRDLGGGSNVTKNLINQYATSPTSGVDINFGGGVPDHQKLAEQGIDVPLDLPADVTSQIADITGVPQRDPQGRWCGAAASCFGILYNARLMKDNFLPVPKTWDDLTAPAMFGRVSAADCLHSSSASSAYEMIIQSARTPDGKTDWPAGWAKLLKIFANCGSYTSGASEVVGQVAHGQAAAGAAIDFYAYAEMEGKNGADLGFAVAPGATVFTPDPIAILKGAPHPEMAKHFVEFILSEPGQLLLCLPAGAPGGPTEHALYRQSVRKDVYAKHAGELLKPLLNPYALGGGFPFDQRAYAIRASKLLGPLMKAAVLDSRDQLRAAWKKIIDKGAPADLVADFVALPPDLADEETALATAEKLDFSPRKLFADDPATCPYKTAAEQAEAITAAWQKFFREKYERLGGK
jgi:ABC-type Fe3+ transport system substrate-binding protein